MIQVRKERPQCPNCKAALSCKCKLRTASDKTQCCTYCIYKYEKDKAFQIKSNQ